MRPLLVATAFLTRVPIRVTARAVDVGGAARWFPLVGAVLGGVGALVAWTLTDVLGLPATLAATVVIGLEAWVTGAIHLDGVADTADGFGGGTSREDVLHIMRDPRIGSYGAIAVVLVIGIKVTALAALLDRGALSFLVAAPAISRWTIPALAAWLPYARADGGLGEAVVCGRTTRSLITATVITAVIAVAALRMEALFVGATAGLTVAWIGRAAQRRLDGVTGDVFGASVEMTEASVLACGVWLTGRI
jgi:cobalamin 5'-phosphate synthase/cobalamin synthase